MQSSSGGNVIIRRGGWFSGLVLLGGCQNPVTVSFAPLPETTFNSEFAPENGWLEDVFFSFWDDLFSGANC